MAAAQPFVQSAYPLQSLRPSFKHITLFLCVTIPELSLSLSLFLSLFISISIFFFLCWFYYFQKKLLPRLSCYYTDCAQGRDVVMFQRGISIRASHILLNVAVYSSVQTTISDAAFASTETQLKFENQIQRIQRNRVCLE